MQWKLLLRPSKKVVESKKPSDGSKKTEPAESKKPLDGSKKTGEATKKTADAARKLQDLPKKQDEKILFYKVMAIDP